LTEAHKRGHTPAQRALDRLPEPVAAAITEFLTGDLLAAPRRVESLGLSGLGSGS